MSDLPSSTPLWVTVSLALASLIAGNLIKPIFDTKATQLRSAIEGADQLRNDMLTYAAQVRAENEVIKQRNDELFAYNVSLINLHIDFRSFVINEASHAHVRNDRGDTAGVGQHLDNIISGAQKLNVEAPWKNAGKAVES